MKKSPGKKVIEEWFASKEMKPFPYQRNVWSAFREGKNGLLNAPTGSGKTFAPWMPLLMRWIDRNPETYREQADNGLKLLWITYNPDREAPGYLLSGHLHPAVQLKGKGRQFMKLPCFYFGAGKGVLPAFGQFTGTHVIKPGPDDRILAVVRDEIVQLDTGG